MSTRVRNAAIEAGVHIRQEPFCVNCGRPLGGWPDDPTTAIDGSHCQDCYRLPRSECKACRDA